ncbi:hypothetical protein PR048_016593 [Dryococelus australis]|uniref:DDE-1 domain-containing protein n=1 Tax=Dryococelus australis TaxID=614101 RepID=A0ABQ9H756_9NEOP|nr:hypothetical protein PR048_016593 [Dryococelus australis]
MKQKLKDLNSVLAVIPGVTTSQLQVLVNKPLKFHLRRQYSEWMHGGRHSVTLNGKIKKPSVTQLLEWVIVAWRSIIHDSIVRGFKKCCAANSMAGTEDDIVLENESHSMSEMIITTSGESVSKKQQG